MGVLRAPLSLEGRVRTEQDTGAVSVNLKIKVVFSPTHPR